MKSLFVVCLLATTASAYPIAYDDEPEEKPPAINKLGFRLGFGRIPTDDLPLGMLQVGIGIEHPVFGNVRMFAEYEWLWVSEVPDEMPEEAPPARMGHRTHLGFRRAFAEKRFDGILRLYADLEVGGGLGLYDATDRVHILPHGLIGLRFGYGVSRSARTRGSFETEVSIRAIVIENGVGFGGGLGFYWGD